ncbi:MAG TPA: hypothetical protein VNZ56_16360 [Verrucomicrobiae bacterium]|jgi:hypothetical protein|nr:hypothetical protein [Verrucomicrobiae bacterium]
MPYSKLRRTVRGVAVSLYLCAFTFGLAARAQDAPKYKFDSSWPKLPLPNKWTFENVSGMYVDRNDHIWVLQRPADFDADPTENYASLNPPSAECCVRPPAVLEFDAEGNLLKAWGGLDTDPHWSGTHTLIVNSKGVVWLGTPGGFLRYSSDGKFLSRLGEAQAQAIDPKTQNNQAPILSGQPAGADLDEAAHEIYIADGYVNKRVVVWDSDTGAFKRGWGAYGAALDQIDNNPAPPHDPDGPPAKQFRNPVHCVRLSRDGLVYVCDRGGDRVQVFTKQGKFLKEFFIANRTLDRGSVGSIDFSNDPQQKYLLVSDIMNNVVWIVNRNDGAIAGKFGGMGHNGGMFHWVHVATMDSRGNIYTGEVTGGKRIQKFVPVP